MAYAPTMYTKDGETVIVETRADAVWLEYDGWLRVGAVVPPTGEQYLPVLRGDLPLYLDAKIDKGALVRNVKDYGAVGDGATDDAAAINTALALGGMVYLPAGTYLVKSEIKVPSRTFMFGAGMDVTTIRMHTSVNGSENVVTNAKNNRLSRTDYDEFIGISDLTIDGDAFNRSSSGSWVGNASCLTLSTVRNAVVQRVRAVNGYLHCFDVTASVYLDGGLTARPAGPSYDVVLRDCVALDARVDDTITTHYSHDILIDHCKAYRTITPQWTGQGIEVDEGSYRVDVRDCYVKGFVKGYQVKGHTTTPPAYDVTLTNCVAEGCNIGFSIEADDPATTPASKGLARNVALHSCRNLGNVLVVPDYPDFYALQIKGYDNVRVDDFTTRDAPTAGGILIDKGATNIVIDGVHGENVSSAVSDATLGFVRYTGTSGDNLTIRNVTLASPINVAAVRGNATTLTNVRIENIVATSSNAAVACVSLPFFQTTLAVNRIYGTGFLGNVEVRGGSFARLYPNGLDDTGWVNCTVNSGYQRRDTVGTFYIPKVRRVNGVVYMSGQMDRSVGVWNSGTATPVTLPTGFAPPIEVPMQPASNTAVLNAWIKTDGTVNVAASATTGFFVLNASWPATA